MENFRVHYSGACFERGDSLEQVERRVHDRVAIYWEKYWVLRQRSSILTKEIVEKRIMLSVLKARLRSRLKHKESRESGI